MDRQADILVVFIDADDMQHIFTGWPAHICLAACLSSEGTCKLVVFHREERGEIAARLVRAQGLDRTHTCFVPQVPGFRTRSFKYSDERRLLALVGSNPEILHEAVDYAMNYTYALEEGLDPAAVLGLPPAGAESAAEAAREPNPLLPEFLRRSALNGGRPRFSSVRARKAEALAG
jgi:hypothetical protein